MLLKTYYFYVCQQLIKYSFFVTCSASRLCFTKKNTEDIAFARALKFPVLLSCRGGIRHIIKFPILMHVLVLWTCFTFMRID